MIDVKNYEGHTPGPWLASKELPTGWAVITGDDDWILSVDEDNKGQLMSEADAQLIADAPKLLAKCKSLAGQLVATRAYLNDLVTFIKEQDLLEFCSKCDAFYTFDDGRQCNCCPSCVGEDYDADDNRTCRDCKIEFSERFYE